LDKYEYKIKEDEIKELVKMREFEEAAEVADTIDWRRVKSIKILCMVSDVYKKLRRYEDSRDMLLLAYERHPGGRTIVYSLCELAIKMGDTKNALEYCKEFIQLAPKDPGRYILQYKLYVAQEVGLEERISVLEELKSRDYIEKWAYELAYLYHQIGMGERCVEECDEMIVWFGEGRYVIKAMELKMLYQPLTPGQQEKYDNRFAKPEQEEIEKPVRQEKIVPDGETIRIPAEDIDIQVKPLGLGQCDTINLQAEVAAGLKEYLDTQEEQEPKAERDIDFEMANTAEFMMGVMQTEEIILEKKTYDSEVAEVVAEPEAVEEVTEEPEAAEEKETEETVETAEEKLEEASSNDTESVEQKPETLDWQAGEMAKVLSVEGDGQISFVVPETVAIEKQITGQMNFGDIMLEWERMKLELEEKRKENVRQMVLKDTDSMFTEFEASVRDDLLEQLENGKSLEEILTKAENLVTEDTEELGEEPAVSYTEDENGFEEIGMEELAEPEEEIGEAEDAFEELGEISEEESEDAEEAEAETEPVEILLPETEDEEESKSEESFEPEVESEEDEPEEDGVEEIAFTVEDAEIEETEPEEEAEAEEAEPEEEAEAEEAEPEEEAEAEEVEPEEEAEAEEAEPEEEAEAEEAEPEEEAEIEEPEEEENEEAAGEAEEVSTVSRKDKGNSRNLTKEERELFVPFIQGRESKEQLIRVLDTISLAAYTGNVVITGREGLDTIGLARSLVRNLQQEDKNFSGKVAKISGNSLNKRNIPEIVEGLINGALIVQRAGDINESTAKSLYKVLQQETRGIVIILEGSKRAINAFFEKYSILEPCFNARIDMEALSNEALVNFAKKYAREQECSIDEFGMLALHQTIAERQTSDHAVTIMEVKDIMDAAIESANRKTLGHFFSILAAKRYDEEDMIIIREKDFM